MSSLNPGLILILGALPVPLLPHVLRRFYLLALPVAGFALVHQLENGTSVSIEAMGMTLELLRVDALAKVWGYIFNIAAFLAMLFAWHIKDTMQQASALVYAGAAVGAVFAGDLVTLFVYWELTAISSVFLIWATRTQRAYKTGMRYLLIQVGSGVILMSGILIWYAETGSISFGHIGIESLAGKLILVAFGIKCAFPFLHNWLPDSYPEATPTGTVVLSAFTTKLAVYALARGYAGTEILIYIGAVMTVFTLLYAAIENDLRRVLAYCLNNQLGFMVVGIGVGSELAMNGVAAHAFSHILYKTLLFMSMGAVLYRAGTCKASELGGLYKSMPITTAFCLIGAAAISAPLFTGFVSKSLIISGTAEAHLGIIWTCLIFASAGVFMLAGIKVPYAAFFAKDSGRRVKEAPWNMLAGMAVTAILCVYVGTNPDVLYGILPFPIDYEPYTTAHVVNQLQLLAFSGLAFAILVVFNFYPRNAKSINLDADWSYRRFLPCVLGFVGRWIDRTDRGLREEALTVLKDIFGIVERQHGQESRLSGTLQAGSMALVVLSVLFIFLLIAVF